MLNIKIKCVWDNQEFVLNVANCLNWFFRVIKARQIVWIADVSQCEIRCHSIATHGMNLHIDNLQVFRLVLYIQSWKRHFEDMSKCFLWKWFNKNEWCVTLRLALKVWRLEKDSCNALSQLLVKVWSLLVASLAHISENMAIAMIFSNLQTFLNKTQTKGCQFICCAFCNAPPSQSLWYVA